MTFEMFEEIWLNRIVKYEESITSKYDITEGYYKVTAALYEYGHDDKTIFTIYGLCVFDPLMTKSTWTTFELSSEELDIFLEDFKVVSKEDYEEFLENLK